MCISEAHDINARPVFRAVWTKHIKRIFMTDILGLDF